MIFLILQAYALATFTVLAGFAIIAIASLLKGRPKLPRTTARRIKGQRLDIGPVLNRRRP